MGSTQEAFIKKLGEQSQCYAILHRESEIYYKWLTHFTSIPVIVLSTIAGSLGFIFSGDSSATTGISVISIFVGILQTLASYFRHAQLSEAHRVCHISYDKLFFNINTELTLPPEERQDTHAFILTLRGELERLAEIAPPIPYRVIDEFKRRYKNEDTSRPSLVNGLEKIEPYKAPPELKRISIIAEPLQPEDLKKPEKKVWK
jgi:uncharacterized membrane protein YtjA (UPF0391 family)